MQKEQNKMLFKIMLKVSIYDYINLKNHEEYKYVFCDSVEDLKDEMIDMVESVFGSVFDLEMGDIINYISGNRRDILSYDIRAERLDNISMPGERIVQSNIKDTMDSIIMEIYEGSLINMNGLISINIDRCALVTHRGSDDIDTTPVSYDINNGKLYYD